MLANKFVKSPNLPFGDVSMAIIGEAYESIRTELQEIGIYVVTAGQNSPLDIPVRYHSDMICHYLGDGSIIVAQNETELADELKNRGFKVFFASKPLEKEYPKDTILNCARIGDKLLCGKSADSMIIEHARENGIKIIRVNQGYSRCSSCIIDEHALITSDPSIYEACIENGIDALNISKGNIQLNGYNYGFIGGATAKVKKDLLLTFGNVFLHPNAGEIIKFCSKYGVSVQPLSKGPLTDIGGIIPIMEK